MKALGSPWWAWTWPPLAWLILLLAFVFENAGPVIALAGITLLGTVFTAVYHAEVIAHRLGEPFGTLVLALAVTIIETALIVSVMIAAPADKAGLARDTVFAAVMLVCNGIVGFCLLLGGTRHREQGFQLQGASAALAVLTALTFLALILPNYAAAELGSAYSTPQLVFAGVVSLVLYGAFLFVQTVRHRDFFLPVKIEDEEKHESPPSGVAAVSSACLLFVCLLGIVGLAKVLTPTVEFAVAQLVMPKAVVGVIIAALVLLPEALAASRAARLNRLQTSLNLALGSALATIGLTIPAVAAVSIVLGQRLQLGLDTKDQGLLAVTLILSVITLGTGRTTVLQGIVHLVMFAAFMFFVVNP
ncbi:calcium:proton antiporter [Bradyrhizobium sp. STM 3557]|uniref:calcium:proton antiporter n=1 Tax=Bradyrhizobium sp. STM 3557 TaxID=578920 RepID=UPI00388EB296